MAKIYLASSWKNKLFPQWVTFLTTFGHEVYDFRNPPNGRPFSWEKIDPGWRTWTASQYMNAMEHKLALEGFQQDFEAMQACDVLIALLPCGKSAHLELGWAAGKGKRTILVTQDGERAELMAMMCDRILTNSTQVLNTLSQWEEDGEFEKKEIPF